MMFEVEIETPDGRSATFLKDYPTAEIARILTEEDLALCDALFSEDYDSRRGQVLKIREVKPEDFR